MKIIVKKKLLKPTWIINNCTALITALLIYFSKFNNHKKKVLTLVVRTCCYIINTSGLKLLGILNFIWSLEITRFLSNNSIIFIYSTAVCPSRSQCYHLTFDLLTLQYIFTCLTFILMQYLGSERIRCNIENKRKYARGSKTFWKGFWPTGFLHPIVKIKMVAWNFVL